MKPAEVVGIYIDGTTLYYSCAAKGITGWRKKIPGVGLASSGELQGTGTQVLREFLLKLKRKKSRKVNLALPRDVFYARDIRLPPMPLEDAVQSVKNSMALYTHLKVEDIYYDLQFSRIKIEDKEFMNVLLIYALRSEIDRYINVFENTGHRESVGAIFPLSAGIGSWLRLNRHDLPVCMVFDQGGVREIAGFGKKNMFMSMTVFPGQNEENQDQLAYEAACNRFPYIKGYEFLNSMPESGRADFLPSLSENVAAAAAAPSIASNHPVSIDASPVKIKVVKPLKILLAAAVLIAVLLFYVTDNVNREAAIEKEKLVSVENRVETMEKQVSGLENKIKTLDRAAGFSKDIEEFLRTRPRLYTWINRIAELVPEGTWFSSLTYHNGKMRLRGESADALKTLESLRGSELFSKVGLVGSVNRLPSGGERFTLDIEMDLKEQEEQG